MGKVCTCTYCCGVLWLAGLGLYLVSWTPNQIHPPKPSTAPQEQRQAASQQGETASSREAKSPPERDGQHPTPALWALCHTALQACQAGQEAAYQNSAMHCFGLFFLICKLLNECKTILTSSGSSYCRVNSASLMLTFQKGKLL